MAETESLEADAFNLHLETLKTRSVYGADVVRLYHEALAVHEAGNDLHEFLHEVELLGPYSTSRELGEQEIDFITAGAPTESGKESYGARLRFVLGETDMRRRLLQTNRLPPAEAYEKLHEELNQHKDKTYRGGWLHEIHLSTHTNLDQNFTAEGQRKDQLEHINFTMAGLSLAMNEPYLAEYFSREVKSTERRMDLYFRTQYLASDAAATVSEAIGDIEQELQVDPVMLAWFKVRQIRELGPSDRVDVETLSQDVQTLAKDPRYLDWRFGAIRAFGSQYELASQKGPREFYHEFPGMLLFELGRSLAWAGRIDAAKELVHTELSDAQILTVGNVEEVFAGELTLIKAATGRLEKQELKSLRQHINAVYPEAAYARLALALADSYVGSRLSKVPAQKLLAESALMFPPEAEALVQGVRAHGQLFHERFPALGAKQGDLPVLQKVKDLAAVGQEPEAQAVYYGVLESKRKTTLSKLLGATVMAEAFKFPSNEQINDASHALAILDALHARTNVSIIQSRSVVEKSEWRSGMLVMLQDIEPILDKITEPTLKAECATRTEELRQRIDNLAAVAA